MTDRHTEIAETIRDRIRSGEYQPGKRIPSQSEMADEFDTPHRLIGFIIAELREQGYVYTVPHKGSYVRSPEHWPDSTTTRGTQGPLGGDGLIDPTGVENSWTSDLPA